MLSDAPMPIWQQILVRVLRTYIQTFLGFVALLNIGNVVPGGAIPTTTDASQSLVLALWAALFPTIVALLQNSLEFLVKLDKNAPQLRG